jgi:membrane protease YdiL (CAAX protease family)
MADTTAALSTEGQRVQPWTTRDIAVVSAAALACYAAIYLTQWALAGLGGPLAGLADTPYLPVTADDHIADTLLTLSTPAAIWWWAARPNAPRRRPLGLHTPPRRWAIGAAAAAAALIAAKLALAGIVQATSHATAAATGVHGVTDLAAHPYTGWSLAANLITTGLLTGLGEELFYRGMLFTWLRSRFPGYAAYLASAAVFAAMHPPTGMPLAFAFGLALAWIYARSHSIWPGIAIHAAANIGTALGVGLLV